MSSFVARAGTAETFDDTFVVVLAETPHGDARIEIQRGLAFDSQDKALGMDTYCLCTEVGTHYGGVESWRVNEGRLQMKLDDAAAKALRLDGLVSITLEMPAQTIDLITASIERALNLPMSA